MYLKIKYIFVISGDGCSFLTLHQPKCCVAMVSKCHFPYNFLALACGSRRVDGHGQPDRISFPVTSINRDVDLSVRRIYIFS